MSSLKENRANLSYRTILMGIALNIFLSIIKSTVGMLGNSHALLADGIESLTDVLSSLVVIVGIRLSCKPADETHPYGHGKFEPLSALFVAAFIFLAAFYIAYQSILNILEPHELPKQYTLYVLIVTIILKELLYRYSNKVSVSTESTALKVDSWHHRSDSITSIFAFIGISLALYFGKGYENLDDYAALLASIVIAFNGMLLLRPSLLELIDTAPNPKILEEIRDVAMQVEGVLGTHKCLIRKLGFDYYIDLDILCNPELTIREGHDIAHAVGKAIQEKLQFVTKVLVHVEPVDDFGRR